MGDEVIVVCNFQPVLRENYRIGVPIDGTYSEVFNTEWSEFGGCGISNGNAIVSEEVPMHGLPQSITLTLPPLSVMYFKCIRKKPKRKPRKKAEALTDGEEAPKTRKRASKKAAAAEGEAAEDKPKRTRRTKKADAQGDAAEVKPKRTRRTKKAAAEEASAAAETTEKTEEA